MKKFPPTHRLFISRPNLHPCVLAFLLLMCGGLAGPGYAALLDDVFDIVNRTENKLDNTRDRIIDMQPKLNDVQTKVTTISANVSSTVTNVLNVRGRVEDVQLRLQELRTNSDEMITSLRTGVNALAGSAQSLIDETIVDLQQRVDEQLAGRDEFVANDAAQFRADLLALMNNIEGIINTLSKFAGTNVTVDFDRPRALITTMPDRALYPIYRVLQASMDLPKITATLGHTHTNLSILQQVFEAPGPGFFSPAGGPVDACQLVEANPELISGAIKSLKVSSMGLKLTAKAMEAMGGKLGDSEITVGGWGFVLTTLKINIAETLAKIMEGVSDGAESVATKVEEKVDACEILSRHAALITKLNELKTEAEGLDNRIAARASQSSLDALVVTVGTLNTAPLDVDVSTRATQTSVDALATRVADEASMALRLQIELQLSDNTRQPSVLYLPEALGGKLGLVRSIAAQTLATNQAAGIYQGTGAAQELQRGDAAASTNNYRGAFDSYRRAYQEITKSPVVASLEAGPGVETLALSWPSDPGGIYCVELSLDLQRWNVVMPKVIGTAGSTQLPLMASGSLGFYRVYRLSSYDPTANRI